METNPLPHNKNIPGKNTCFFMRAFVFCFLIGRVGGVPYGYVGWPPKKHVDRGGRIYTSFYS